MKRIVLLNSYFPYCNGGAEFQVFLLSQKLKDSMEVYFLSEHSPKTIEKKTINGLTIYNVRIHPFVKRLFGPCCVLNWTRIMPLLKQIQPHFIYQRSGYANTGIAAHFCQNSDCKFIWHIAHEREIQPSKYTLNRHLLFELIDKKVLEYGIRNADFIIGQSQDQNRMLSQNYQRTCDLILKNFQHLPVEKSRKHKPLSVIWVANLKNWKQPDIFIKLAAAFHNKRDVKFIMIGHPGSSRYMARLIPEMEKIKNLSYLGGKSIEEVNTLMEQAHIFVNTSVHEGFPNTFIQAWMREVPVISLHVDPDNVLKYEKIGFCSGSFAQLVIDLKNLLENNSLRKKMGEKALQYATKHHSIENIDQLSRLFESLDGL